MRHKKTWRFQEPKTKRSKRTVTISASLSRKLAIHKRNQAEQRLKVGNEWEAHDLVFCSEFGTPLSIPNLTYRYFRPILEKAELPKIRLYDLRHSHATLLLAADEHLKVVSERLGHSTIRLAADTYSHVLEGMQQGNRKQTRKHVIRQLESNMSDPDFDIILDFRFAEGTAFAVLQTFCTVNGYFCTVRD